jgi:integrase
MSGVEDVTLVPEPSEEYLGERQLFDYREHRKKCIKWLLGIGKNPDKAEGYAFQTVYNRAYRMDQFYRFVWELEGGYTVQVTHNHADEYMQELAYQDHTNAHKDSTQKAVKMLFKWLEHERGYDHWEPEISFSTSDGSTQPRDYLTADERRKIREAALEYGSIPAYKSVSPNERDRWKAYLAQRFEKPKSEVKPADWERANGWKIPSLVSTSLDAGLRPIEVERAVVSWVDLDNGVLRIPKEESSKNVENWIVPLRDRTVTMLERWLEQRDQYEQYSETEKLWLTRQRNPYQSSTLGRLLRDLCEIAGIDCENRKMSWYAVRHSTGTYMVREEDLAAAQSQLRHKRPETTMKYDQVPPEDRKDALDRMG